MDSPKLARLREAIVSYARFHPDASDTANGILGWWLPATGFDDATLLLHDVLAELVSAGVLRATSLPDASLLYSVAPVDE